jgi:1-acyl-sn-glycerol-3-phosphate acyltransferase
VSGAFRVAWRLPAIAAVTLWGLARVGATRLRGGATAPRLAVLQRAWAVRVLRLLGARLNVRGETAPSELLVTNHLSYVDILVLSARVDAVFVAKREVAGWPLVGPLCRAVGTLFVDRERHRLLPEVLAAVTASVREGRTAVIFPEGTSTGGAEVLPFKPALLEAAAREGWRVGWAALRYRTPEGAPPASEAVCWWRDMTLLPHLLRLLALPGFEADLIFGDAVLVDPDRKRLADRLWQAVHAELAPAP